MSSQVVPLHASARASLKGQSVVIVNTGNGKGKSTAAFGTALRAVARGWKVCVIQFMKSDKWKVGEKEAATRLGVEWWTIGDGFTWDSRDLDRTEAIAREAWRVAQEKIQAGAYGLVVLDEITYPMNWGWISTEEVVAAIAAGRVVDGRGAARPAGGDRLGSGDGFRHRRLPDPVGVQPDGRGSEC